LLDELSDLPDRAQAQLARALDHSVNAGLQIVVTLRSADRAVSVRPELLHRIAGVRVELPPLRERREDIVALASRFLQDAVSCTEAAQRGVPVGEVGVDVRVYERMLLARWPGNVRQLRMVADRMIADQPTLGPIGPDVFPSDIFAERLPEGRLLSIEEPNPSEAETLRCLLHALRDHSGNVSRAASAVGITRQRAYRLLGSCGNTTLSELRHGNR
jgi:DNA-binding NtrC family response regulator